MAETQATGTSCGKWGRPGCSWWSMGRAVGRITMGQITIWCVNFGDVPKNDVSWKIHDFPTCSHNGRGYQLVLTMDGHPNHCLRQHFGSIGYIYFWARQRHNDIEFWRRLMCCCRCFAHVAKHDLLNFDVNMNLTIFLHVWTNQIVARVSCGFV